MALKHLNLSDSQYKNIIKLVIAAGKITSHSDLIASGVHRINVLKPETLQALLELKLKAHDAIDLSLLRSYLEHPPFGTAADQKIMDMIRQTEKELMSEAQYKQQGQQLIQTVKELTAQPIHSGRTAFSALEIRAHHNAKHQPLLSDAATDKLLDQLSGAAGYLARKRFPNNQQRFRFKRDMPAS